MKFNSDLTKTLIEMAAKTTIDKITGGAAAASQNTPQGTAQDTGTGAEPDSAGGTAEAPKKSAPDLQPQEPFGQMLKGIGTQVAAAVTEGLSKQIDKKVEGIVHEAELAVERQRLAALGQMQTALAAERTNVLQELEKTACSISNKLIISATFIGGSLLAVAAAVFLHK
jgi:hypothetical protein